jgi:hypothetical protein
LPGRGFAILPGLTVDGRILLGGSRCTRHPLEDLLPRLDTFFHHPQACNEVLCGWPSLERLRRGPPWSGGIGSHVRLPERYRSGWFGGQLGRELVWRLPGRFGGRRGRCPCLFLSRRNIFSGIRLGLSGRRGQRFENSRGFGRNRHSRDPRNRRCRFDRRGRSGPFIREETTAFRRWKPSGSDRMETTGFLGLAIRTNQGFGGPLVRLSRNCSAIPRTNALPGGSAEFSRWSFIGDIPSMDLTCWRSGPCRESGGGLHLFRVGRHVEDGLCPFYPFLHERGNMEPRAFPELLPLKNVVPHQGLGPLPHLLLIGPRFTHADHPESSGFAWR